MRTGWTVLARALIAVLLLGGGARAQSDRAALPDDLRRNGGEAFSADPPVPRATPLGMQRPLSVFTDARGRECHVYAHTVTIDGGAETAFATLCRQPNGRWVLVQ